MGLKHRTAVRGLVAQSLSVFMYLTNYVAIFSFLSIKLKAAFCATDTIKPVMDISWKNLQHLRSGNDLLVTEAINYITKLHLLFVLWRLSSLLLDFCNSFLITFHILSVSITLDEGSDRLFSETRRSGAVCTGLKPRT